MEIIKWKYGQLIWMHSSPNNMYEGEMHVREVQRKTMRNLYAPIRMSKIRKRFIVWRNCNSNTILVGIWNGTTPCKTVWQFSKECASYDRDIPLLGISTRDKCWELCPHRLIREYSCHLYVWQPKSVNNSYISQKVNG